MQCIECIAIHMCSIV